MELDDQLRQLAAVVPAPPPGDASALYARGLRRRRWRQVGRVTAALLLVGALGVGTVTLLDRPARLDIADRPTASASALTLSSHEPFPWVVAFSAQGDGRWCVTAARDARDGTDASRPCTHELRRGQDVGWIELGGAEGGGQRLAAGIAPADTDHVVVELTDGTRRAARLATAATRDATLWAIGYEQGQVRAVEAQGDGSAAGAVAMEDGWGVPEMLLTLVGVAATIAVVAAVRWRVTRRRTPRPG